MNLETSHFIAERRIVVENFTLSARQKVILELLNHSGGIMAGPELARKVGITTRTLRTEIRQMQEILDRRGIRILSHYGKGYELGIINKKTFQQIFSNMNEGLSKTDRIHYMMMRLMNTRDRVDMYDMEDEMFVSRSTLESDLKELQRMISRNEPFIGLMVGKNQILLEDDELKKRDIMIRILMESWDFNSEQGIQENRWLEGLEYISHVQKTLYAVFQKRNIHLDEFQFVYLTIMVLVIYTRNLNGYLLYSGNITNNTARFLSVAHEILDNLGFLQDTDMEEGDYEWLAESLSAYCICNGEVEDVTVEDDHELVAELIDGLRDEYGTDFSGDTVFRAALQETIRRYRYRRVALTSRMQYLYQDIERNNPILGDMDRYLEWKLEAKFSYHAHREERGHLLPVLAAAWIRYQRSHQMELTAVIVSGFDSQMRMYTKETICRMFGGRMHVIACIAPFETEELKKLRPSLIISTQKPSAERESGVPVVSVSPVLQDEDVRKIHFILEELENDMLFPRMKYPIESCFPNDLRNVCPSGRDLREVLSGFSGAMKEKGYIKDLPDLSELRFGFPRERMLFCYCSRESISQTVFAELTLNREMMWNKQYPVNHIIFGAVSKGDLIYIGRFYRHFGNRIPDRI